MSQSIYFIDTNLNGYQTIVDTLAATDSYYLINSDKDGLVQIANILSTYSDIDQLHIFSHGSVASLHLGSTVLDQDTIASYSVQLQTIGDALSDSGDILLYGCNVAQGSDGEVFINTLAEYTGADVAASTDITGSSVLGGDWILEAATGAIEATAMSVDGYNEIMADNTAPRFNLYGFVTTAIGLDAAGYDVALQSDEKILVAGYSDNGMDYDFALTRYNSNGTLDASFGTGGIVTTDFGSTEDQGNSVTVDSNGMILIAGTSNDDFALIRYDNSGNLDTAFGTGGMVTTDFGFTDQANSIVIQPDGKILVSGYSRDLDANSSVFALARYNSDGTLDTTFSDDGKLSTDIDAHKSYATSITLSGGGILVAGYSYSGINYDFTLVKYDSSGNLDTSFGTGGIVTTDLGLTYDQANSVTVDSDGKILVAGYSGSDFALVRYNSDGSLDTSFGAGGIVTTDFGLSDDQGNSVTIDSNGMILVAGTSDDDFALVRYESNGNKDTTFGTGGMVTTNLGSYDQGYTVIVQSDGKILVTGQSYNGTDDEFALIRYNSDGSLDTTFNAISTLDATPTFTIGDAPIVLDNDVQVQDTELSAQGSYNGAILSIERDSGASADDVFSINGDMLGNGDGDIVYAMMGEPNVGSYTYTDGTLVITFNHNADQYFVNATLQSIKYENVNPAASGNIQINWNFSDGNTGDQGDGGALSALGNIVVNIVNNNNHAPTITSGATTTIAENDPISTVLYTIIASDVDAGTTLTYSLSGTDTSFLNINTSTGEVTLKASANFEAKNSYSFNVIAGDGVLSDTKAITATVTNVNEAPIIISGASASIAENTPPSTLLYTAAATDIDTNSLIYSLSGTDASFLNINNTTGAVTLKTSADYETKNSYNFNLIASDGEFTDTKSITLTITDVNESRIISTPITLAVAAEDTPMIIITQAQLLSNATHVNNALLSVHNVTTSAGILHNNNDGTWTLTPALNYNGTIRLNYDITDGVESIVTTATQVITAVNDEHEGSLTILGTAVQNQTLHVSNVLTDIDGMGTVRYQWLADGISIAGATNETLSLGANDVNKTFAVIATYMDGDGTQESVISQATDPVRASSFIGNNLNNIIVGNSDNNTIDGREGADIMLGGAGNDTYIVERIQDRVYETTTASSLNNTDAGGTDLVISSVNWTLGKFVEKLYLKTTNNVDGTGNEIDNIIYAGDGNNKLDGAGGIDTLSYYYALSAVSISLESIDSQITGGSGIDTIQNFENLTGSDYNDILVGNSLNNTLCGGMGNDTLTGGGGNDTFVFNSELNKGNTIDTIVDFSVTDDTIQLSQAIFTTLSTGTLSTDNFIANSTASAIDSNDYILYDTTKGTLFYDADGSGVGASIQIAILGTSIHPTNITYASFAVI